MMDLPRPSPLETQGVTVSRHGPLARVGLLVVGAFIALGFGTLTALLVLGWREVRGPSAIVGASVGLLVLLTFTTLGGQIIWRGLRGRTTYGARFARLNRWPNQPTNRRRLLFAVAAGYVVVLTGIAVHLGSTPFVKLQRGWGDGGDSIIWWMALWMLALPIHVAVHELGHAVAGSLAGFRVVSVRIGSLLFRRERSRWSLERKPTVMPMGLDGFVGAVPGGAEPSRARLLALFAGGVLANLALAILCFGVLRVSPSPSTDLAAIAQGILSGGTAAGVFMAFANLLPIRVGTFRTDGSLILRSLSTTETADVFRRVWLRSARGHRPRTWGWTPEALLKLARRSPRHTDELGYHAFLVALDAKQSEVAVGIQSWFVERWSLLHPVLRELVAHQTALARALEGEPGAAKEILRAADRPTQATGVLGLLEATIAAAEGDTERARARLARWEEAVSTSGLPGARVGLEWAVDALRARVGDSSQACAPAKP